MFGVYISRKTYIELGQSYIFSSQCPGALYTVDSRLPPSKLEFLPDWVNDDQWGLNMYSFQLLVSTHFAFLVCVFMDAQHTFVGRSSDEDPLITIPMKEMSHFFSNGTIQDWKIAKAVWRTSLTQLDVSPTKPRGMAFCVPTCCTRNDVRKIIEAMFTELPITSLLLTNVWIPALIAYNLITGVVVHVGHTDTVVVSMVCFSVSESCIIRLPFGAVDAHRRIAAIVDVCACFSRHYLSLSTPFRRPRNR